MSKANYTYVTEKGLTGNLRYVEDWLGRIILQVEITLGTIPGPEQVSETVLTQWRYATVDDINKLFPLTRTYHIRRMTECNEYEPITGTRLFKYSDFLFMNRIVVYAEYFSVEPVKGTSHLKATEARWRRLTCSEVRLSRPFTLQHAAIGDKKYETYN